MQEHKQKILKHIEDKLKDVDEYGKMEIIFYSGGYDIQVTNRQRFKLSDNKVVRM